MTQNSFSLLSLRRRITALILVVGAVLFVLIGRLFFIQVISSNHLQSLAEDQWTRSLPIYAERGKIVDRNLAQLAVSETSYNLFARAREIKSPSQTANILANILDKKFSTLIEKISDKSTSEILVATEIDTETAIIITQKMLDGIYLAENCKRFYPNGNLLTQVLGFTTSDNQGQAGLELYYNDYLRGKNGYSLVQSDLTGATLNNTMDIFLPATKGNNITLTIDKNLQIIVENALEKIMTEQKSKSASGILMNAKTGELLAMSTKPSFDLNNVPRDNIETLMATVKNQMVVDVYEPGSTFKIITMAIALETGIAKLSDHFYCPGYIIIDGEKIKCWKSIGHGSQTLAEGLANSCNCVFTTLANRIGLNTFYDYLEKFGYGQRTGIEISGESSGILMNPATVKTVDLARMGFGQAIAVTPIQQIVGIACAVNGGKLIQPYIVDNITDANGKIIFENTPKTKRQIIGANTSKILCDMLDLTVSMQTGKFSFVPGYAVGGKTGTTQKYENGAVSHNKYISSFVGTYPVNNPEYILLISVDEPMAGAYYGSIVASPYAKTIFSEMFKYYNIAPDDPAMQTQTEKIFMPNLVGLPIAKAVEKLSAMQINFEIDGNGKTVLGQIPSARAEIYSNDTILIKT